MANIEEKVESLITETIQNLGYELYDVIYEKEAQDYYLRIFIDNSKGISLNDCEKVNDAITDMLDEANYIKDPYFLEVSSPGIERLLRKEKHLKANIENEITCNLFKPITINAQSSSNLQEEKIIENPKNKKAKNLARKNTFKQVEGILKSFDENKIVLQVNLENKKISTEVEIDRKNIANMKVKYNWE